MAYKSDYNFVGGYDHGVQAGLLHVANHHVSPGKKQWTWGNGEFGQAWDRNLTDEDGPYIELMTGVYTDNQPDFSWLQPYEEKSFKQYFMPYKNIGVVKNASIEAAINLEVDETTRQATVQAYATGVYEGACIELRGTKRAYLKETVKLSPVDTFKTVISLDEDDLEHDLKVIVRDGEGRELIAYQPKRPGIEEVPEAAKPLPEPEQLRTNEQLYLAGLHLEQYRHATFEPEQYYLEGLKRDQGDIRINVAYGTLLLRRGLFKEAEEHFRQAVKSLTWRNPNPYDSEAYYQLGVALMFQDRLEEAFAALYKSTWSAQWQDAGYFTLAQIAGRTGRYGEALELVDRSLIRNSRNYRARHLRAALLRKVGRTTEALAYSEETLKLDIADFGSANERSLALAAIGNRAEAEEALEGLRRLMRGDAHNYLNLAADYASAGFYEEAISVLGRVVPHANADVYPMLHYTMGDLYEKTGDEAQAAAYREAGRNASPDYCFPNSLFDLLVLDSAIKANRFDDRAHYLLGNLKYDKKRTDEAIAHWEVSASLRSDFPTVHRNLALAYFNKKHDPNAALEALERAFSADPNDARICYELDQLYKKLGYESEKRLSHLQDHMELVGKRDDLYLEYVTLLGALGRFADAAAALASRNFHPWEGGEGKTTGQHVFVHVEMAKEELKAENDAEAVSLLQKALVFSVNLGEGKLAGAQENNIYYYLGCAYEGLGQKDKAVECFTIASRGLEEPASAMYYNDQPPDMIFYQGLSWRKLGNENETKRRFNKLIDYAEKHLFDDVKIDYFAVSLPDFLVFEDDLNKRNQIHCHYMRGLGLAGLGRGAEAAKAFDDALRLEPNHVGARIHKEWC
jgi:tetratricopeptide (TPR) repeat protein